VDPEGYLFLSVGVDCVHPSPGGLAKEVDKRENMFKELPQRIYFQRTIHILMIIPLVFGICIAVTVRITGRKQMKW
jgi:hypothetical protein